MAAKSGFGTAWVPAQGDTLMEATKNALALMDGKYEQVTAVFNQLRGEEIIGESETKTALLEVIDNVDLTFKTLNGRLDEVRGQMNELYDVLNQSASSNISHTQDAGSTVAQAAKQAQEVTGDGAQ